MEVYVWLQVKQTVPNPLMHCHEQAIVSRYQLQP